MSREELVAFDRELQYRFTPENFTQAVLDEIGFDFARLNEYKGIIKNGIANVIEGETQM